MEPNNHVEKQRYDGVQQKNPLTAIRGQGREPIHGPRSVIFRQRYGAAAGGTSAIDSELVQTPRSPAPTPWTNAIMEILQALENMTAPHVDVQGCGAGPLLPRGDVHLNARYPGMSAVLHSVNGGWLVSLESIPGLENS